MEWWSDAKPPTPAFMSMNLPLQEDWRQFPLSPSEGERAGVRGPFFRWGSGRYTHADLGERGSSMNQVPRLATRATRAKNGLLSPALSSKGGEGETITQHARTDLKT